MANANSIETNERIDQITGRLKRGDYVTICDLINGAYSIYTVRSMFRKNRTMNPGVLQTAETLILTTDNLKKQLNENTED